MPREIHHLDGNIHNNELSNLTVRRRTAAAPNPECRCDCVNCVTGNHTGCYYAPSVCPVKFAKRDIQP